MYNVRETRTFNRNQPRNSQSHCVKSPTKNKTWPFFSAVVHRPRKKVDFSYCAKYYILYHVCIVSCIAERKTSFQYKLNSPLVRLQCACLLAWLKNATSLHFLHFVILSIFLINRINLFLHSKVLRKGFSLTKILLAFYIKKVLRAKTLSELADLLGMNKNVMVHKMQEAGLINFKSW